MLKTRFVTAAALISMALVGGVELSAQAASPSVSIHLVPGQTISAGASATIKPHVVKSGYVTTSSRTISVKKGSHTFIQDQTSAKVKAGTYVVTTRVAYRTYRYVTKTHDVARLAYYPGTSVASDCTVTSASSLGGSAAELALACHGSAIVTAAFAGEVGAIDHGDGTWTVNFNDGTSASLTSADLAGLTGQAVSGVVAATANVYHLVPTPYKARAYSATHHKSRTQTLQIKTKSAAPTPTQHPCTHTSSGTCIQGGEFCPQAKYGQSGWDAAGRRYVCEGDHTHPHWYKP